MSNITFWLIIFSIFAYLIIIDEKFSYYIVLSFKYIGVQLQRKWMMFKYHPFWITNPIGKWWTQKKYYKTAIELKKILK